MLRATLELGEKPWKHAALSGFIVDPDRKKMSKSKGNVVTPADMLEQHGSDAVRYWAASSRLGTDAAFDPQNPTQIKIGRRLAIKVLNASKFILSFESSDIAQVTNALDLSMLASLRTVVADATAALTNYDHAKALEVTESFFWTFCDDYLELVKERAYNLEHPEQGSAVAALRLALNVMLRLFAPVIPFATAEVWSWYHGDSVHRSAWPVVGEFDTVMVGESDPAILVAASAALIGIRRGKTDAKASQKTVVLSATINAPAAMVALLTHALDDLRAVGRIEVLTLAVADDLSVTDFELAPVEPAVDSTPTANPGN
jgi:valyl-tRNA synthetase